MRRGIRACIAAVAAAGTLAAIASTAHATVTAYNEPAYTKTAGNNAYWFNWQAVTGTDENSNTRYEYYLCFNTYQNNTQVESSNGTNGPGTTNCTGSLRAGPTPSSGNYGAQPFTAQTVLANGSMYELCASDYWRWPYTWHYGTTSCAATVIDRTAPSAAITLAGGAAFTNNANLAIRINYSDAISPPWYDTQGRGFTWGCLAVGGPCAQPTTPANGWSWHQGCSVAAAQQRTTFMDCAWNLAGQPDGAYHYCANVADFAVPDNPSGTNQFVATADQANRSSVACDSTVLDRGAPSVTLNASATTVNAGDLVSFSASASDGLSGGNGAYAWTFGDNTAPANGSTTTHTYTQPGTYVAKVTTADNAGNPGEATKTITVNAAPGGGGTTTTPTTTTPTTTTPTSTTPTTTTPSNTTTTPSNTTTTPTDSGTPTGGSSTGTGVTPSTSTQVAQQVGQNSTTTQKQTLGSVLGLLAPRALTLKGKRPALLLGLTALKPGVATIDVRKGRKRVARKLATLPRKGVFSVRVPLPATTTAGAYTLKVTYKPLGGAAVSKVLPLTLKRGAKARAAAATPVVVRPQRPVTRAPRASRRHAVAARGGWLSPR